MLKEFKEFISRGNVVDLAVGVIIGAAFGNIVTSLVNNIFTPLIGIVLGGQNFSALSITLGDAKIMYGAFIQSIIDFLINAICLFIIVKIVNKVNSEAHRLGKKKHKEEEKEEKKEEVLPPKAPEIELLEEIRDLLKKNTKGKSK